MLKIPLETSIRPFFRPFVHAYPLTQAFSASNIHPSIRPFVFPSLPLLSIQPSMSPSVLHPSIRLSFFLSLSFCLSIPPFDPLLVRLSVSLSIPTSVWPIVLPSVCPSICPPASWSARPSVHPSINQWISYEYFQIVLDHSHYRLFFKQQYRSFRIAHGLPSRPQCQRVTVKPVICCVWVNFTFSKTSLTYFRSCLLRWEWWDVG